jgi:hypothetical protein
VAGFTITIPAGALSESRSFRLDGFETAHDPTLPNPGFQRNAGGIVGLRVRGDAQPHCR